MASLWRLKSLGNTILDLCHQEIKIRKAEYDTDSKTWHFARGLNSKTFFRPFLRVAKAIGTNPPPSFDGDVRQLQKSFSGIDHHMLQDCVNVSEATEFAAFQHDPTVADLIAFGNAYEYTKPKPPNNTRYRAILAVAGGAAGELVRIILLSKENLAWENYKGVELKLLTNRSDMEAWWRGNGGKIQQIIFASKEKTASSFMAVRYQGAISLLKLEIQVDSVCPSNVLGQIQDLPPSRLVAIHVITLGAADARGVPFADVSFDPWNHQRFITVDQKGCWQIWSIQKGLRVNGIWTFVKDLEDTIIPEKDTKSPKLVSDGWAKAFWAGNSDTIVLICRTSFVVFDTKTKPIDRTEVDLGLAKSSDWISDVKKSLFSESHFVVVTSTRIILLEVHGAEKRIATLQAANTLISWIHFRAPNDDSLLLSVIDNAEERRSNEHEQTTMIALYSRLNGLISVFGFHYNRNTGQASSAFDPCLLPLPDTGELPDDPQKLRRGKQLLNFPLGLSAISIPIDDRRALRHHRVFDQIEFYAFRILNHDLSFLEHLYIRSIAQDYFLESPYFRKSARGKKTPVTITDDFIVPDGVIDDPMSDTAHDTVEAKSKSNAGETKEQNAATLAIGTSEVQSSPRFLDMHWLVKQTMTDDGQTTLPFDGILNVIQDVISEKTSSSTCGAETLLELGDVETYISDMDDAASSLKALLSSVARPNSDSKSPETTNSKDYEIVLLSLLPVMSHEWNANQEVDLLQFYGSLVRSHISSLSLSIPGRVRIEREKKLRSVAAHLFLAAHTISVRLSNLPSNEANGEDGATQESDIYLPVREKESVSQVSLNASDAASQSSSLSSRPLISNSKPKAAKSSKSGREFLEDASSIYLRNLVSVKPQPRLPPKLSNILSHWSVGGDPALYDWEAAQNAAVSTSMEAMESEQTLQDRNKMARKRARNATVNDSSTDQILVQTEGESSTQPVAKRRPDIENQGTPTIFSSTQIIPESSQIGPTVGISSQPLPGQFAGGRKEKKGRKKGF